MKNRMRLCLAAGLISVLLSGCVPSDTAKPESGSPEVSSLPVSDAAGTDSAASDTSPVSAAEPSGVSGSTSTPVSSPASPAPSSRAETPSASVFSSSTAPAGKSIHYSSDWKPQLCTNYHYNYQIIDSLLSGTLSAADQSKLDSELKYYNELNSRLQRGSDFEPDEPGVIGDAAAIQKAKEVIRQFFGAEIPEGLAPSSLGRFDFSNAPGRVYHGLDMLYTISFEVDSSEAGTRYRIYGAEIDAKTGKYLKGYTNKILSNPWNYIRYKIPPEQVIAELQDKAKSFVTDKNIIPGAKVVYLFSSVPEDGTTSQMQTSVYLDNGYVISVSVGYLKDSFLDFYIYPTHGFQN